MTPGTRFRHRATTSASRWAVALRALRRAAARLAARRRSGSVENYLDEIVRDAVDIPMSSNEISHSRTSHVGPLFDPTERRSAGRPPTDESKHRSTQLSTTFNQSEMIERSDS